jgi:hypothetical protein
LTGLTLMASTQVSPVPRYGFQFGGGEEDECIGKSAARKRGGRAFESRQGNL